MTIKRAARAAMIVLALASAARAEFKLNVQEHNWQKEVPVLF